MMDINIDVSPEEYGYGREIEKLEDENERLRKRAAELEGDNHCLRVNLQALVTETPSGWTLTLEQAKADAMQALEDCKALSRKDGE